MEATRTEQPTVYIVVGESALAYDERGEVIETVEFGDDGKPDWTNATICDHRGAGGAEGFAHLGVALNAAERNAQACGVEVRRVGSPSDASV